MTSTAVTFLVISVTVIWGGLVASVLLLRRDSRQAGADEVDEG